MTSATTTTATYTERVIVRRRALVTGNVKLFEVVRVERKDNITVRLHVRSARKLAAMTVADGQQVFEYTVVHIRERKEELVRGNV